ncbi:MAG: hypothetical protein R3F21_22970 [Myxococcota bacterium]
MPPAKIHVPKLKELSDHLEPLVGRTTTVTASAAPNKFKETALTARYLTRDDKLAALCHVDFELAAFLGAALAMVPVGAAQDCVKEGKLNANLTDAFREVANILAGVLCVNGAPHVRWTEVTPNLAGLAADAKAVVAKPCDRFDVRVEIDGYGGGQLTILTAKLA